MFLNRLILNSLTQKCVQCIATCNSVYASKSSDNISYAKKVNEQIKRNAKSVDVWNGMTASELAHSMGVSVKEIHKAMQINEIYNLRQIDNCAAIVKLFKFNANMVSPPLSALKQNTDETFDINSKIIIKKRSVLARRPPVVTIMGHVDHGKTTLLDSLRNSELVKQEHGGITQHIGAFVVSLNDDPKLKKGSDLVSFLDTPGHAAFHAMRERGANITDIVVLVVAADDGVMPQTIESIQFANASNVPIIVAINKIDKVADIDMAINHVKRGLASYGIAFEEDGGDVQAIKISALKGVGLNDIKEAILALSETMQIQAYVDGTVEGVVLESKIHEHRGRLATILIQNGTLKKGDIILAGESSWAKVRSMFDEWGNVVQSCLPGFPIQVIGWRDDSLPVAGDKVWQFDNEKKVKEVYEAIQSRDKLKKATDDAKEADKKLQQHLTVYKAELNARREAGIRYKRKILGPQEKLIKHDNDPNRLNIILKADVNGSMEVLLDIIDSYPNDRSVTKLNLIHYGVGPIIENDVELAACFANSIIYTFNIGVTNHNINKLAKELNVKLKRFNVIYHLVDDLKEEISEKLPLLEVENILGEGTVLQEFVINDRNKKIPVAGSRCVKGVLKKHDCFYKVLRKYNVIASGLKVSSLRHLKDESNTIKKDVECGIRFEGVVGTDGLRFEALDTIVCYEIKNLKQSTKWSPPGF